MRRTLGRRGVAVAALTMMTVGGSAAFAVVPARATPATTVPPTAPPTTRPAPQPAVAAAPQAVAAPQAAPTTFQLPAPAAVGQHATLSVALDAETAGPPASGALSVRVSMSRSVTGVDGSGGFDVRSTIAAVEVAQAPSGFNSSELDGLSGVAVAQSFTSAGAAAGAPVPAGGGGSGSRELLDWIGATSIGFPDEPIAVGASWSSPGRAGSVGGIVVPVSFQCRLASVDGGQYVVEVSYASDFTGVEATIGVVSGTVAGWGTVTGSLDNPLVVGGSVNQSIDGQVTVGTMTTPLAITSTLTVRPGGG